MLIASPSTLSPVQFDLDDYTSQDDLNESLTDILGPGPYTYTNDDDLPNALCTSTGLDSGYWAIRDYRDRNPHHSEEALFHFIDLGYSWEASTFEDAYQGQYDTEEAYARELVDDCYTLEEPLANYFDYAKYARDLFASDYTFVDGFVFRNV